MRRLVAAWEALASRVLLPLLLLLVGADVALRYVFNAPLAWGTDVKELLLLLVVTAGLAGNSLADEHIRVSLFEERMPPRAQRAFARIRHALTAVALMLLAWSLAALALDMREFGERAENVPIPFWPLAALVALSAALAAAAELSRLALPGTAPEERT